MGNINLDKTITVIKPDIKGSDLYKDFDNETFCIRLITNPLYSLYQVVMKSNPYNPSRVIVCPNDKKMYSENIDLLTENGRKMILRIIEEYETSQKPAKTAQKKTTKPPSEPASTKFTKLIQCFQRTPPSDSEAS